MNNHIQLVLKSSTTEMSLNDHDSGIYIVPELEGLTGLPSIRTTSGVNSGYDGGWTSAQNFDARSITIRGVIASTDVATVERMRKQLIALLAQGKNEPLTLNLVTEAGNAYELEVRTIACEMAMQTVLQQQEFLIQLRADDPLIYDSSAGGESVLVQVQHAIGGFEINFELPLAISGGEGESIIENAGLEKVYPVISMYGALHNPTFVNATTNQQIQVDATLGFAEGEWSTPSDVYEGKVITINDAPAEAQLASFRLDGETSQNGTPTPSAPVAVNTTTGENVVKITGKNLLKLTNGTYSSNGVTAVVNNGVVSLSGTATANAYVVLTAQADYYSLTLNGSYKMTTQTTSGIYNVVYYGTSSTMFNASGPQVKALNGTYNNIRFQLYIPSGTNTNGITTSPMIIANGTDESFEPYQEQSYEVNLGKNLFDKDTMTLSNVSINPNVNSANGFTSVYIPCEPNTTYTVQKAQETTRFYVATTEVLPAPGVQGTAVSSSTSGTVKTFTTGASARYIAVMVRSTSDTLTEAEVVAGVQIEKGSQATSYAAYFEPIELCKIGDYQDYIYKSGDKWYVHKAVGKVILDGVNKSFSDRYTTASSHYRFIYADQSIPNYTSGTVAQIYCNRLIGGTIGNTYNRVERIAYNDASNRLISYISSIEDSTLAAANTWLQSNPLDIVYILDASTDTEITNEALVAQLNALLTTARTYVGINNIFTVTPNEQGTIELTYMTEKSDDRRDVIVIDSRMRTITLNGTDAYHLLAEGSEFPLLAPGENKLLLRSDTPGDNGYAEVNYKQGYLSI